MSTNETNFKCPETGREFFISQYSTSFKGSEKIFKDKWGKQLVNEENGVILEFIDHDRGFCTTVMGSKQEQYVKMQDHLKQRSKEHYQKDIKYQRRHRGDLLGDTKHNK